MTTSMSSPHGSSGAPGSGPSPEIPEGMRPDARETWPSKELIDSFLGTGFDFELRLGEHTADPDRRPRGRRAGAAVPRRARALLHRRHGGHLDLRRRAGRDDLSVVLERLPQPAAGDVLPGEDVARLAAHAAGRLLLRQHPQRGAAGDLQRDGDEGRGEVRRRRAGNPRPRARRSSTGSSGTSTARSTRCTRPVTTTSWSAGSRSSRWVTPQAPTRSSSTRGGTAPPTADRSPSFTQSALFACAARPPCARTRSASASGDLDQALPRLRSVTRGTDRGGARRITHR